MAKDYNASGRRSGHFYQTFKPARLRAIIKLKGGKRDFPSRILDESEDTNGHKNIFNRGGNNGLHSGGVLSRLKCHGTCVSVGVGQHELFAVVGKIFRIDAGDGLG